MVLIMMISMFLLQCFVSAVQQTTATSPAEQRMFESYTLNSNIRNTYKISFQIYHTFLLFVSLTGQFAHHVSELVFECVQ